MPCGNVWVTNFETNEQYFSYICWPGGGLDGENEPPDSGGGGGGGAGPGSGVDGGGPIVIPGPVLDSGDSGGDGTVIVGGDDGGEDEAPTGGVFPNPGWNSGAHSVESLPADWNGAVSFDVPDIDGARQGGVAVGFVPVANLPTVGRNGYGHMPYGLVFTTDYVRVIHAGQMVLELDYIGVRANREPDTETDVVQALMYGNFVKWIINGETVFGGLFSMPSAYALDATLYLTLDAVDNPMFEPGEWGDLEDGSYNGVMSGLQMEADMTPADYLAGQLQSFAAQYSDDVSWNLAGSLRGFSYQAGDSDGITGTLSGFQMIASDIPGYTPYVGSLKSFTMQGGMSAPDGTVDYSVLYASMKGFRASMEIEPVVTLQGALKSFEMVATFDNSYMELRGSLKGFRMNAYGGEMTPLVEIVESIGARIPVYPSTYVGIMLIERIGGAVEAVGYTTVTADGTDSISAEDDASYTATLLDTVMEMIGLGERAIVLTRRSDGGTLVDDGEAWVVNSRTRASTRYDQYGFNGFATVRGRHFGARADGVYLLDGADDAGVPITSGVSFGKQDFGAAEQKTIRAVYVGVSSQGNMFLKVGDGKSEYTYRARRADDYMRQQRFDPGKGLRSTYFTFTLTNETDAFELDSVRFDVVASQRRIG